MAIDTGSMTNLEVGDKLIIVTQVTGVDPTATITEMVGGTDQETDDELRVRVLERIQKPPMGGDADDYVQWALSFPGVTRAWCSPKEMGLGTVTVRFMMELVAGRSGWISRGRGRCQGAGLDRQGAAGDSDRYIRGFAFARAGLVHAEQS